MHDIRFIREHPDIFDRALQRRDLPAESKRLIAMDEERRKKILELETAQARRNAASKEIGEAKKTKNEKKATELMAEVAALKDSIPTLEATEKTASMPLDDVPDGKDAGENVEHHRFGAKRNYTFMPKQHFELGEALGQMDFETAAKLSGARFVVLKSGLARLERVLAQLMLDLHTSEHGYIEVAPPLLVRDEAMFGTAQLPKFEEDQFFAVPGGLLGDSAKVAGEEIGTLRQERYGLIPTAEVPLTNLVRESIIDEAQLPMRLTAGTPCFRAEAG